MRLCYVLFSPTWGMHQYTADLAQRRLAAGDEAHLVTTRAAPLDRYAAGVARHTPAATRDRGFSTGGLRVRDLRRAAQAVCDLQPDVVHVTGPHVWNPLLLARLRRTGIPAVHTLHDLHPHAGAGYGRLLEVWNRWVCWRADHLLVHGERFRRELVERGVPEVRVSCTPLTHLFVGPEREAALRASLPEVRYEPFALFVGRLEAYKGLGVLVEAARRLGPRGGRVVIAGAGPRRLLGAAPLPDNVELRLRLVGDDEAVNLFARCSLVVLPYVEASQSALAAAAYFFRKPVLASRAGALPEYVIEGETGWLVPPGDAAALAEELRRGLGDADRLAQMGQAARAWYDRRRAEEGEALERMYAALAGGTGHAGRRAEGRADAGG